MKKNKNIFRNRKEPKKNPLKNEICKSFYYLLIYLLFNNFLIVLFLQISYYYAAFYIIMFHFFNKIQKFFFKYQNNVNKDFNLRILFQLFSNIKVYDTIELTNRLEIFMIWN